MDREFIIYELCQLIKTSLLKYENGVHTYSHWTDDI